MTLCFLGEHDGLPPPLVAAADTAGRSLHAAPFELSLDRVMSFASRKPAAPLVLCRDGNPPPLDAICRQLGTDTRGFTPHVTLLYDPRRISAEEVAPLSWTASEVLLIHSLINRSRHEVLGRYPLR